MLDVDHGTYPYVTSSNTGIAGIIAGLTLNPRKIDEVVGVVKSCMCSPTALAVSHTLLT